MTREEEAIFDELCDENVELRRRVRRLEEENKRLRAYQDAAVQGSREVVGGILSALCEAIRHDGTESAEEKEAVNMKGLFR